MTDLTPGSFGDGYGINEAGHITGEYAGQAAIYRGGGVQLLPDFGAGSTGYSINDSDAVVGSATVGGHQHAFVYIGGMTEDLGTLGGDDSSANSIDNANRVVGTSTLADGTSHAFLEIGGFVYDLNNLVVDGQDWVLSGATGISDTGYIVGVGEHGGETRAFILTPVPEPSTWALICLSGLAAIYARARRRLANATPIAA